MQANKQVYSQITMQWKESLAVAPYSTGVSLHSHTSLSEETLSFIQIMSARFPGVAALQNRYAGICTEKYGITLDFQRANWRPPLQPKMAYECEAKQIRKLGLYPLVSITDHDTIEASQLLRTVPSSRHIPVSVEWSAPFGQTIFHMGIHNLPSSDGHAWMERFAKYTEEPHNTDSDATFMQMLRELHEQKQVLIILNHPFWDLHEVGPELHRSEVRRFLKEAGPCIHALELNGLRHAQENREIVRLARETGHLVISGGDRHGMEPNANINLTCAENFTEFVEEVRVERVSHVHFMDQYAKKWEQRIVQSTLAAVNDYPQFMPGWQRWDDRVFHPDQHGEMRQLSSLWHNGRPPRAVQMAIMATRLFGMKGVSAPLSLAFPKVNDFTAEMGAELELS